VPKAPVAGRAPVPTGSRHVGIVNRPRGRRRKPSKHQAELHPDNQASSRPIHDRLLCQPGARRPTAVLQFRTSCKPARCRCAQPPVASPAHPPVGFGEPAPIIDATISRKARKQITEKFLRRAVARHPGRSRRSARRRTRYRSTPHGWRCSQWPSD
jgi:hypothetical protein